MTSSATSSCLGEPWIDGDDVYWLEGRPTEGGRRVLVRAAADGSTADLTPPPFNVRTPRPRVRRRLVRRRRRDRRLLRLRRRPAVPARPGCHRRRADHAGRSVALRRPPRRPRPPPVLCGPRGPRRRRASEAVVNTIVAIPLDGGDPCRPRLGTRLRRLAAPVARRDAPCLAGVGPPGHALGRDAPARRADRARRHARRVDPGRRRAGRVDRPARVGARRDAPPDQRPERLVEPVSARRRPATRAARADGGRVRRSGLDLRSLVVRVPAPTARSSPSARLGRVRPPLPRRAGRPRSARSSCRSRSSTALRVGADGVVALAGAPSDPCGRRAVRPGHAAPWPASCAGRAP